jgi:hypothetical protein
MNFLQLKEELKEIVGDRHQHKFSRWINNAVLELSADFEFPTLKLREPVIFNTKNTQWLYDLPNTSRTAPGSTLLAPMW